VYLLCDNVADGHSLGSSIESWY